MENLPQTPSELLGLMASTSTQIDTFSDGVIESVKNGEVKALSVVVQLKAMELASERIKKEIKDNLMREVDKYPEKDFVYMGNKIAKAEHGTKYDFTKCGDPEWESLDQQRSSIAKAIKEREEFLKTIKGMITVINPLTGELCELLPPTKTSVSGINISIR